MKALITFVVIIAAALSACYLALGELFDGLSSWRIAGVVMIGVIALAGGILLTLALVNRLVGRARMAQDWRTDPLDGDYNTLPSYRPPQPQHALPAPAPPPVINVPRFTHDGRAQPFNMPAAPIPVLRTVADDAELSVPLNYLQRFLSLSTPARSEWSGKREMYSACLAFCEAHGLLERDARGGASWRAAYPIAARQAWAARFVNGDR